MELSVNSRPETTSANLADDSRGPLFLCSQPTWVNQATAAGQSRPRARHWGRRARGRPCFEIDLPWWKLANPGKCQSARINRDGSAVVRSKIKVTGDRGHP